MMETRSASTSMRKNSSPTDLPASQPVTDSVSDPINVEDIKLYLVEAMASPDVVSGLFKLLKPSIERFVAEVDANMSTRMKSLEQKVRERDTEIKRLNTRIEELEDKLDDQEQYSRRTSVRIAGIPENDGEDPHQKVMSMFSQLDHKPLINRVHRVGPKTQQGGPRSIICQFTTYPDKYKTMLLKKQIRSTHPNVFINEDLTRSRSALSFDARKLKREGKISDTWTADGRIVVKDNNNKIHYLTRRAKLVW